MIGELTTAKASLDAEFRPAYRIGFGSGPKALGNAGFWKDAVG